MKKFIIGCMLLGSSLAFAQDAGVVDAGSPAVVLVADAGVAVDSVDAGVAVVVGAPSLEQPWTSAKGFYTAVKTGNGWLAAMFMLFFLVGAIRTVGKKLHAQIPDDTKHWLLKPVEQALFFIFDTKIGGWVLNWLSAIGGCLSAAMLAGMPVDAAAWKVAILASTGGTALIELKDDVMEWWTKRQEKAAAEAAAKAAVVAPPVAIVPPPEAPKP